MFTAIVSRPDIAQAVRVVSRFVEKRTNADWNAVKRIIKYMKQTENYGVRFEKLNK